MSFAIKLEVFLKGLFHFNVLFSRDLVPVALLQGVDECLMVLHVHLGVIWPDIGASHDNGGQFFSDEDSFIVRILVKEVVALHEFLLLKDLSPCLNLGFESRDGILVALDVLFGRSCVLNILVLLSKDLFLRCSDATEV
jgi:hypothetical protein